MKNTGLGMCVKKSSWWGCRNGDRKIRRRNKRTKCSSNFICTQTDGGLKPNQDGKLEVMVASGEKVVVLEGVIRFKFAFKRTLGPIGWVFEKLMENEFTSKGLATSKDKSGKIHSPLKLKEMTLSLNNSLKKSPVNVGSLSHTIDLGRPCSLNILSKN